MIHITPKLPRPAHMATIVLMAMIIAIAGAADAIRAVVIAAADVINFKTKEV